MSTASGSEEQLGRLVELQAQVLEELQAQRGKKKDNWDRLSTLSTFLASVVIGGVGLYFTHEYDAQQTKLREQQTKLREMEVVQKLIPHLIGKDEKEKQIALLAINSLGSPGFVANFAKLNPSKGADFAADLTMATAASPNQREVPAPVTTTAGKGKEGWAYLGHYIANAKQWETQYFDFTGSADPTTLKGKALKVHRATLNIRSGMPTPAGQFPEVVAVLRPGSEVQVNEIQEWQSSGYMWARVTYGP